MNRLNFRKGQIYTCTKSKLEWWTVGKEYNVVLDIYGCLALSDNNGNTWWSQSLDVDYTQFKLKLDINELTKEQLKEYNDLIEDKEKAERCINEFIDKIKK